MRGEDGKLDAVALFVLVLPPPNRNRKNLESEEGTGEGILGEGTASVDIDRVLSVL